MVNVEFINSLFSVLKERISFYQPPINLNCFIYTFSNLVFQSETVIIWLV